MNSRARRTPGPGPMTTKKATERLIRLIENDDQVTTQKALQLIEETKIIPSVVKYVFDGRSALMEACDYYNEAVALAIIETGKSGPDFVDPNNGGTALLKACQFVLSNIALAIIATGHSKPGHINDGNVTALQIACFKNMSEVALALIATGQSKPGHITEGYKSPLMNACANNMSEVALALIATGHSKPEYVDRDGHNAMYYANINGMVDVQNALLGVNREFGISITDVTGIEGLCGICMEPLTEGNIVRSHDPEPPGSARHLFHKECLTLWCERKAICMCPICNAPVAVTTTNPVTRGTRRRGGKNNKRTNKRRRRCQ